MPCCGDVRRKQKNKRIIARRNFEANAFKHLREMKEKNAESLNKKLLDEFHRKCHMLYSGAIKYKPPNKMFIQQVVELHNQYISEMKKKGMKHNTPLYRV